MIKYLKTALAFRLDRRSVTTLEYAIIAGLLVIAVLIASTTLGVSLDDAFVNIAKLN